MRLLTPIRLTALSLLALSAFLHAQSRIPPPSVRYPQATPSLPPTAPTTTPASTSPEAPPTPVTPASSPAQRAKVSYTAGQLTVSASNSSLNQILREVARLTGIKITGGVAEERVYGDYGPAEPSEVLNKLLDGTSSNMLFIAGDAGSASELILTPRTGSVTPPNPNAARFDDNDDDSQRQAAPPVPPEAQSQPAPQNPVATPITPSAPNDPNTTKPAPASNDSNQQSPNGTRTPQQIYDELMRLRRQQQSQPQ